jgi:hypothetical protein
MLPGNLFCGEASVNLSGGHILSFRTPDGTGISSARFHHDGWTVEAGNDGAKISGIVVTAHEAMHAALNSTTSWGGLLQVISLWLRHEHNPGLEQLLADLVSACRRTHEAFATHASVLQVHASSGLDPVGLLVGYPNYLQHLDQALDVGPPDAGWTYWRGIAIDCALTVCMQSPALAALGRTELRDFRLSMIPERDHPDRRLDIFCRARKQFWEDFYEIFADDAFKAEWAALSALTADSPDAQLPGLANAWAELWKMTTLTVSDRLDQLGYPALPPEEMHQVLMYQLGRISHEFPDARYRAWSADTSELAGFGLFENERMTLHPPLAAKITEWIAADPAVTLLSGSTPARHIYVVARSVRSLREQFVLPAGTLDGEPADSVIVAVQVPRKAHDGSTWVDLIRLGSPAQLGEISAADTDLGIISNVSLACSLNAQWRTEWLPSLHRTTRITEVLDLPFTTCAEYCSKSGYPFNYTLAMVALNQENHFVLGLRLDNDPPILAPCTLSAGQSLVNYAFRVCGGKVAPDLSALGLDLSIVGPVLEHLVYDESIIQLG